MSGTRREHEPEAAAENGGDSLAEFRDSLSPMLREDFDRTMEALKDPEYRAKVSAWMEKVRRGEFPLRGRWVDVPTRD